MNIFSNFITKLLTGSAGGLFLSFITAWRKLRLGDELSSVLNQQDERLWSRWETEFWRHRKWTVGFQFITRDFILQWSSLESFFPWLNIIKQISIKVWMTMITTQPYRLSMSTQLTLFPLWTTLSPRRVKWNPARRSHAKKSYDKYVNFMLLLVFHCTFSLHRSSFKFKLHDHEVVIQIAGDASLINRKALQKKLIN